MVPNEVLNGLGDISQDSAEATFIKVKNCPLNPNHTTIIGAIYCLPHLLISPFINNLEKFLNAVKKANYKIHIAGDSNVDLLSYLGGNKTIDLLNTSFSWFSL